MSMDTTQIGYEADGTQREVPYTTPRVGESVDKCAKRVFKGRVLSRREALKPDWSAVIGVVGQEGFNYLVVKA